MDSRCPRPLQKQEGMHTGFHFCSFGLSLSGWKVQTCVHFVEKQMSVSLFWGGELGKCIILSTEIL